MILKIGFILIFISIFFSALYGIDKITAENPSDAALIRLGLSDIDSSSCKICSPGELYYDSGCKRCIQDNVVLTTSVASTGFFNLGWSNDYGMYYGDEKCTGSKNFENIEPIKDDTLHIEIIKNDLTLTSKFYNDANFLELRDEISIEMCSNPTNLQYIRISNEDGKPAGNGGKLFGYVDEIKIWNSSNKNNEEIFSTSFDECEDETCDNKWILQNSDRIFINTENSNLEFFSEVTGTNDYAHLKLDDDLPNSWMMTFILHIDELEEHPRGKGILNIEPEFRQLFFGIPALIFPLIAYTITRKIEHRSLGIFMTISGVIIAGGLILNFNTLNEHIINNDVIRLSQFFGTVSVSILIIILGIFKMKISKGNNN